MTGKIMMPQSTVDRANAAPLDAVRMSDVDTAAHGKAMLNSMRGGVNDGVTGTLSELKAGRIPLSAITKSSSREYAKPDEDGSRFFTETSVMGDGSTKKESGIELNDESFDFEV